MSTAEPLEARPTGSPFDSSHNGGEDGFVAVFPKALNSLTYATFIGSADNDSTRSVRALSDTSFVLGAVVENNLSTSSPDYIVNEADSSRSGDEGYIAEFSPLNTLVFGTYVGGNGDDSLSDVRDMADGADNIHSSAACACAPGFKVWVSLAFFSGILAARLEPGPNRHSTTAFTLASAQVAVIKSDGKEE